MKSHQGSYKKFYETMLQNAVKIPSEIKVNLQDLQPRSRPPYGRLTWAWTPGS